MKIQANMLTSISSAKAAQVNKEDAKLKKACQDFESMLVKQMLDKMRGTVQKTDLFGSSQEEQTFQDMLDQQFSTSIAQSGSMKLGDMLYKQISKEIQNTAKVSGRTVDK
jgi:flagellar protein FlgJ